MSNTKEYLLAAFLIIFGIIALPALSADEVILFEDSTDTVYQHPDGANWSTLGTHDNTLTDAGGDLAVNDTSTGSGTFTSDLFGDDEIVVEIMEVNASLNGHTGTIELRVRNQNGAVVEQEKYTLEEDVFSYDVSNFSRDNTQPYSHFQYVITLNSGGGNSAEVHDVTVDTTEFNQTEGNNVGIMVFAVLFLLGIWMLFRAALRDL